MIPYILKQKSTDSFYILTPFLLIYIGTIFQNLYPEITATSKTLAFIYMLIFVTLKGKINLNLFLTTLLFLPFLIYGILVSFNLKAGISDGIRYLFPIVTLYYSYTIKDKLPLLIKFIIVFILINFIVQFFNYYFWLKGIDQWFYYETSEGFRYYNETSGIIRATGIVVFFGFFGFFNLISFIILQQYYNGRFKKIILIICLICILISLSYKTLFIFLILMFIYFYKSILKFIPFVIIIFLILIYSFYAFYTKIINDIYFRFNVYISEGDSMRSESYRVMFENIKNFNLFGKGVGAFGGPASIKYNSPYYQEVYFYWYDTKWLELPTTDTYPPHLFVELGIIGGIIYFLVLFTPLLQNRFNKSYIIVLVIYFILMFDMLFSFSLNNLEFLMFSLVFIYPILNYKKLNNA